MSGQIDHLNLKDEEIIRNIQTIRTARSTVASLYIYIYINPTFA
jgi:hypothetical protein